MTSPSFALRAFAGRRRRTTAGRRRWGIAVVLACLCSALLGPVRTAAQDVGTDAQRESGKQLYAKYCSQCHNDNGDGEGHGAPHLRPRPRNFTTGKFKVLGVCFSMFLVSYLFCGGTCPTACHTNPLTRTASSPSRRCECA